MIHATGLDERSRTEILEPDAIAFLAELHRRFDPRRARAARAPAHERHAAPAAGGTLDFLPETREMREGDWQVAPPRADYADRRVEITGPTDRKLVINALNSGARGFMADFEDANSPTWANQVSGHANLVDAIEGTHHLRELGRARGTRWATTSPRCWCARAAGTCPRSTCSSTASRWPARSSTSACSPSTRPPRLLERGSGPVPLPAQDGAATSRRGCGTTSSTGPQDALGHRRSGTIRATVLIETLPAAFEMEEILYELREHSYGLNAGRWDYIFSMIKCFRDRPEFVLPDRNDVKMTVPFMRAYAELLVRDLPPPRRLRDGRDGRADPLAQGPRGQRSGRSTRSGPTRSARPASASTGRGSRTPTSSGVARDAFDAVLGDRPNQIDRRRDDVQVTAADLLDAGSDARARSPRRACAATSAWASSTSRSGSAAAARPGSTTSWRTPRPPRSRARRSGSGSATAPASQDGRDGHARARARRSLDEEMDRIHADGRRRGLGAGPPGGDAGGLRAASRSSDDFPEFLTLPGL